MKRAVALSFLLACSSVLLADAPDSRGPSREAPSLLKDLVRMTDAGLSDATVLAYARAHRVELPPELTADELLWLRKSGVSETVVRYMAAIDVRASDSGVEENAVSSSEEAAPRSAAADSYSYSADGYDSYPVSDSGSYPVSDYANYAGGYYDSYPATYFNDYYPLYPAGYYPYPVYFFVNHGGFHGRFHGRGHGFARHRGHDNRHGGFGRPRVPRGGFDRGPGRHRENVFSGHRDTGRPRSVVPRGNFGQGLSGPRASVIRGGGPGRPISPRGGFGQGSMAPRGPVARGGGPGPGQGRPAFAGGRPAGGSVGRGSVAPSGGGRGAVARPAVGARR